MSQPTPSASGMVGRVFSNRYEVLAPVARGGMAEVYRARDNLLGRPVALKILHPEFAVDQNFVERFRREAQAAANLNHPHIVAVYDWGQEDSTYFIVLEFVEGRSLRDVLRADGRLPVRRVLEIGAETASALHFAHRLGVVHRDVKPGNILITTAGDTKVTDFGIARGPNPADGLTQTGAVIGTATYFSPEQAQGFGVDARSDVYSLGCLMYEALAGAPPFSGDSPVAVAYKHVREEPRPLRQVAPETPADLEAVVGKCLAKNPDNRYQSAEELRQDLARFAQGQPVTARATVAAPPPSAAQAAATAVVAATPPPAARTQMAPAVRDEPHYYESPRRWPIVLLVVLLIAGIVAGLLLLARSLGVFGTTASAGQVTVPNVINVRYDADAKNVLERVGLIPSPFTINSEVPEGLVITTEPPPGTDVDRNTVVRVAVSGGRELGAVPNVVNRPVGEAEQLITEAGFEVGRRDNQPHDQIPENHVISQDPPPGNAPRGTPIHLVISGGRERVQVPEVVGRPQFEAVRAVIEAGLIPDPIQEPHEEVPEGTVIRSDPPQDAEVDKGSRVQLFVSRGPETIRVPGVVGSSEAQARSAIEGVGLSVGVTYEQTTDPSQVGIVMAQNPAAETEVRRDTEVTIVVGEAPATTTTTTLSPPPTTTTTTTTTTTPPEPD